MPRERCTIYGYNYHVRIIFSRLLTNDIFRFQTSGESAPAIADWTGKPLLGWDGSNNMTAKSHPEESVGNEFVGKATMPDKFIMHENTRLFENPKVHNSY